jgi:indole-3-glycerol phosphate synthase
VNFLDEMAAGSHSRWRSASRSIPLGALIRAARALPAAPALKLSRFDLIAEVKRSAPSVGTLAAPSGNRGAFAATRARRYALAGAAAISVLTEPSRFDGDPADLTAVAKAVGVPAMRKDFLVDPYQVWEARAWGAGGVLLITRMVDDVCLAEQIAAAQEAGLFALIEAFDVVDLERTAAVLPSGGAPVLVGVNTRNLATLQVSPTRLADVAHALPHAPCVAESGMHTPDDIAQAVSLSYRLGLVGTALMRSPDPAGLVRNMIRRGRAQVALCHG